MRLWRRHDGYVLRAFLSALGTALLFLTSMVVIYDLADRIDRLPRALRELEARGWTPSGVLLEYYATLVPFLWLQILPISVLIAAGLSLTWLSRQNEIGPLVSAGVPTRRVLLPILVAALAITGIQMLARETVVPGLSRRHDDLHRLLSPERKARLDRFQDVPHIRDSGGGRLSMSAYIPPSRRIEGAWITFSRDASVGGARTAYRYPVLEWDAEGARWHAGRGGERYVLSLDAAGSSVVSLTPADAVPLKLGPSLLELTLRQSAAMGLSSAEISQLASAHPDRAQFRLLFHQQLAGPVATLILLLIGLPFAFRLGRSGMFPAFAKTLAVVALYFVAGSIFRDFGVRGALNPVVAAWAANVVFGALGIVLWTGMET